MLLMHKPAARGLSGKLTLSSYLMCTFNTTTWKLLIMLVIKYSGNKLGPPIRSPSMYKSERIFFLAALLNRFSFSGSKGQLLTTGPARIWTSSICITTGWFKSAFHGIWRDTLPIVPNFTSIGRFSSYWNILKLGIKRRS